VTGGWRKLHHVELHILCSRNIIRMIKPRSINGGTCSMDGRDVQNFGQKTGSNRRHLGHADVYGRIILIWILRCEDMELIQHPCICRSL
jgi:hypothetical protein